MRIRIDADTETVEATLEQGDGMTLHVGDRAHALGTGDSIGVPWMGGRRSPEQGM